MRRNDKERFKKVLLEKKAQLRERFEETDEALKASSGGLSDHRLHMADMATDSFDKEFATNIAENEEQLFNRVDLALAKIEDGTYGVCDNCGKPIADARLEAVPYAEFCIRCQETFEKENRRPQARRESGAIFEGSEIPAESE